jgi:LSD1 subclass zinc finger protein
VRLARAAGSGCSNVLLVIPIGASTVRCMYCGKGWPVTSITSCCATVKPPPE